MPRTVMDEQQLARYLHLNVREVLKLASREKLPGRRVQGRWQFRKGEIDHWIEERMHTFDRDRLEQIERGVSDHHGFEIDRLLVCPLIPHRGVALPLLAKSRDKVIRGLVDLADECGRVWAKDELLEEIFQREQLCTTGLAPGVAIPHPREHQPYEIAESFVVVGKTAAGVPFGSVDGSLTRLFFLVCCKDDRTHLHVLARLGQMLHEQAVVEEMLDAEDPGELRAVLVRVEEQIIGSRAAGGESPD